MHEIQSSIEIDAQASLVWAILVDFASYRRWNPFIRKVQGRANIGSSIQVTMHREGSGTTVFRPVLTHLREPRELRWHGRWALPGLYAAEHRFRIESLPNGNVRFHQTERFRGLLVPFVRGRLNRSVQPAFQAMNAALKARAERVRAS